MCLSFLHLFQALIIFFVFPECSKPLLGYQQNEAAQIFCYGTDANDSFSLSENTFCFETESLLRSPGMSVMCFQIIPTILFPIIPSLATCFVSTNNRNHFVECFSASTATMFVIVHMIFLFLMPCILKNIMFVLYMFLLLGVVVLFVTLHTIQLCKQRCTQPSHVDEEY